MNLLFRLPLDLQRKIYVLLPPEHRAKTGFEFSDDDPAGKMLLERDFRLSPKEIHQILLENLSDLDLMKRMKFYDIYLAKVRWNVDLVDELIKDDYFIKKYINSQDISGFTMLIILCNRNDVCENQISHLLMNKADVNIPTSGGHTPLIWTMESALPHRNKTIAMLIEAGANVNAESNGGRTALMSAETVEDTKILIDAGAKINHQDNRGWTPLMLVILINKNDISARVKLLIDSGADVNIQSRTGTTALMIALSDRRYNKNTTELVVKMLIEAGANVHLKNDEGHTALMLAFKCFGAHPEAENLTKLLLAAEQKS